MWRKRNLAIFRIANRATERLKQIKGEKIPEERRVVVTLFDRPIVHEPSSEEVEQEAKQRAVQEAKEEARRQQYGDAEEQARQELGDIYELADIGEIATIKGLTEELDVKERLDRDIHRCLKLLLTVRGVKSLQSSTLPAVIRHHRREP